MRRVIKLIGLLATIILITTNCTNIETPAFIDGQQYKLYENKELGFTLEFPAFWDDNYIIHEYEGCIEVCFIGQSEVSKELFDESDGIHGLSMFFIGDEAYVSDAEFLDSIYEIGEAKGIKYYYFTGTDYSLGALMDENIDDEKEKNLASIDLEKARAMEQDKEDILRSFKEN